ncbi:hypothetical protein D3C81_1876820 [compost metagenome]
MHRFNEECVGCIAEDSFQAIGGATWRSADTTGQVDEQRVVFIDGNALIFQLCGQLGGCCAVSEKQYLRTFVIHEVDSWIRFCTNTSMFNSGGVVGFVLNNVNTQASEAINLPLLGVRRHVHDGTKAQGASCNTNA